MLFDLDGTLLDVDLEAFLGRYFAGLGAMAAEAFPGLDVMPAVLAATGAMQGVHPGLTNREVFDADFREKTGIDLATAWEPFDAFYRDVFPGLLDGYGPREGARQAVEAAQAHGLKVAVATQPIFPAVAIRHRVDCAGLGDVPFDLVTSYETMQACKPLPAFFRQVAGLLDVEPSTCLMVGDDRVLDMSAADLGMRTFYVGREECVTADFSGSIGDLPDLLDRLAGAGPL